MLPGLISVSLLAAALVLALQLLYLRAGNTSWQERDNTGAELQYSRSMSVSMVNKWIPVHNRGVARFELQRWDAAADDFQQAASLAPAERQCTVRLNWSLALESGADALRDADDVPGALVRYTQAQVVLADTTCPNEPAPGGGTLADAWNEARQRVESKTSEGNANWTPPEKSTTSEERTDELDERAKQAQEERQRAEEQGSGSEPVDGGSGERNW
ncbi:hypothetical protein EAX62_14140 [Tessaracoccus antarcticus]|uniref:Tetratricopeptide repeat protein n=1 Tax=Tessaracoccus antarcticus TaxID=2479848 RepID=A0A3M0G0Q6_9ACTN|nr:hypothetical protein EAX62_14140 [Tessaracoccus antarcticus]